MAGLSLALLEAFERYAGICRSGGKKVRAAGSFKDVEEVEALIDKMTGRVRPRLKERVKGKGPRGPKRSATRLTKVQRVKLRKLSAAGVLEHKWNSRWDHEEAYRVLEALAPPVKPPPGPMDRKPNGAYIDQDILLPVDDIKALENGELKPVRRQSRGVNREKGMVGSAAPP